MLRNDRGSGSRNRGVSTILVTSRWMSIGHHINNFTIVNNAVFYYFYVNVTKIFCGHSLSLARGENSRYVWAVRGRGGGFADDEAAMHFRVELWASDHC